MALIHSVCYDDWASILAFFTGGSVLLKQFRLGLVVVACLIRLCVPAELPMLHRACTFTFPVDISLIIVVDHLLRGLLTLLRTVGCLTGILNKLRILSDSYEWRFKAILKNNTLP